MTATTLHLGQVPGRARRSVASVRPACAWHHTAAAAARARLASGRLAWGNGYTGGATSGDASMRTFIDPVTKRPARHLASRST